MTEFEGDKIEHAAATLRFHRVSREFARLGASLLEPHSFCCFLRTMADATERFAHAAGTWDESAYVLEAAREREQLGAVVEQFLRSKADA